MRSDAVIAADTNAAEKFHFEPPSRFTSLDHLVGAGTCNGGMIPRFHRAVCDYFTFGSAPVPAITRAEKPVLNDSKFSPFPFRHCTCECPRQRPDQSSGFSQSQSYPGRGT
jgi:hypothetical protein